MQELLVKGDMLGDKIVVGEHHIICANCIYSQIKDQIKGKYVIAVGGGSGSGKSETGSLLGTYCMRDGKKAYVLSCDNYPKLPPRDNEKKREELHSLGGRAALERFLGSEEEIDFARISQLVADFKAGKKSLSLRIMDNPGNKVHNDDVQLDVSDIQVLVLEGTWSNAVDNVDLKIFLDVPLHVTLEHRKLRGRDPLNPFGEMVLEIERGKLEKIRDTQSDIVAEPRFITGDKPPASDCVNLDCRRRNSKAA